MKSQTANAVTRVTFTAVWAQLKVRSATGTANHVRVRTDSGSVVVPCSVRFCCRTSAPGRVVAEGLNPLYTKLKLT